MTRRRDRLQEIQTGNSACDRNAFSRGMASARGQRFPRDSCGFFRRARRRFTGRLDESVSIFERAGHEFEREQTVTLERPRHAQVFRRFFGKTEAPIIRLVADQHDSLMIERRRLLDRRAHQRARRCRVFGTKDERRAVRVEAPDGLRPQRYAKAAACQPNGRFRALPQTKGPPPEGGFRAGVPRFSCAAACPKARSSSASRATASAGASRTVRINVLNHVGLERSEAVEGDRR